MQALGIIKKYQSWQHFIVYLFTLTSSCRRFEFNIVLVKYSPVHNFSLGKRAECEGVLLFSASHLSWRSLCRAEFGMRSDCHFFLLLEKPLEKTTDSLLLFLFLFRETRNVHLIEWCRKKCIFPCLWPSFYYHTSFTCCKVWICSHWKSFSRIVC